MVWKNLPVWYQICNTPEILIIGEFHKVKEFLYTQVDIWVNTVLHHMDARVVLPSFEWYNRNQNILNYYPYPTDIKNKLNSYSHCR